MNSTLFDITTLTSTTQLSEFCTVMIPCIWSRSFKTTSLLSPKRHAAFKLFVRKVLKATQISCTCILLALHYIQRLRAAYPSIRASIGSEVRLFTTALVLANKYLDDNTFTNKTWSEVSSIPINELNIMEMEFLSALNYSIYMPHTAFYTWKNDCQEWYRRLQMIPSPMIEPVHIISPRKRSYDNLEELQQQQQQQQQPVYKKKFFSIDQLYYPTTTTTTNNIVCKPILSWSSSVSALSSSKYHNHNSF
ncbi:unnamed protein product [Mucor hiemalis]